MKRKLKAIRPLALDGRRVRPGDVFEAKAEDADKLLADKAVQEYIELVPKAPKETK